MKVRSGFRVAVLIAVGSTSQLLASSCSSSDAPAPGTPPQGDAATELTSQPDVIAIDKTNVCVDGDPCEESGICAGGVCCASNLACRGTCCSNGQVCSFGKCASPGSTCREAKDCPDGDYCEYAFGSELDAGSPDAAPDGNPWGACTGGKPVLQGRCLPAPPACPPTDGGDLDGGTQECLQACEYHATEYKLAARYAWGGETTAPWSTDVMMTPVVIELDDDDCDGKLTTNDIPEIVFTTYSNGSFTSEGIVHAISILQGKVVDKWTSPGANPSTQIAAGDIDGAGGNEVVYCTIDGKVRALHGNGKEMWTSDPIKCFSPALADLDGDGTPEVVVEGGIVDGSTGFTKAVYTPAMEGTFVVSDIDGDGLLDIVGNSAAWRADGSQLATMGWTGHTPANSLFMSGPAVADLDLDGKPEVIAVLFAQHLVSVWRYDSTQSNNAALVRGDLNVDGAFPSSLCPAGSSGSQRGGGAVTIGEFNGDGYPDIALAGGVAYTVFDGKKVVDLAVANPDTVMWSKSTNDCSSAGTGSSLFDFNGDGKAEVIYSDEFHLRLYEGATGKVLFETCNTDATLSEYPVVADVDNDGEADIIVASNASNAALTCEGKQQAGLRIFSSANQRFVSTRRIWNQHSYHVTNVEEDGTIPKAELSNWTQPGLNNFRLNKQPGSEAAAPDAIVSVVPGCGAQRLKATVRNLGQASLPAGAKVAFFLDVPEKNVPLGETTTSQQLYPMQAETVQLSVTNPPAELLNGKKLVYAQVDTSLVALECRPNNNVSVGVKCACAGPY